ncbi:FAD-dependent thymidylate synthase [Aeropyrum pernix]|uniref:FAD-dependent thymidylate synthase n=1 Tax=Aeropyrum pernix TaxID=56636 RepID=UPI001FB40B6C|nr:FAD-dependent thymidylate synthase [Aeropyrum pernix]
MSLATSLEKAGLGISVRLLEYTGDGERIVAVASKVSLSRSPAERLLAIGEDEVETWILETFRRQHFSPWEHSVYTFMVEGLSRVASHQLVRHRVASYTQLSHRYSEGYLRDAALEACEYIGLDCPSKPAETEGGRKAAYRLYSQALERAARDFGARERLAIAAKAFVIPPTLLARGDGGNGVVEAYLRSAATYYSLLSRGARREDARYILPDALRTRIVVTMNARELIQVFFPLRMCTRAQWEIRHIAWLLWRELSRVHPRLFRWAGPSCVLRENTLRTTPASLYSYLKGVERFTQPRCPELVENKAIPGCLRQAASVAPSGDGEYE